jgi:hypothetical protein
MCFHQNNHFWIIPPRHTWVCDINQIPRCFCRVQISLKINLKDGLITSTRSGRIDRVGTRTGMIKVHCDHKDKEAPPAPPRQGRRLRVLEGEIQRSPPYYVVYQALCRRVTCARTVHGGRILGWISNYY